jgi:chaperonin GroES
MFSGDHMDFQDATRSRETTTQDPLNPPADPSGAPQPNPSTPATEASLAGAAPPETPEHRTEPVGDTQMAAPKLRPLHDRVILKRVAEDDKTAGGLIIPDAAKEKQARGTVVAVGPGRTDDNGKRSALDVKKGDLVIFGKYAGTEVKVDGEELIIVREEEILAVMEK